MKTLRIDNPYPLANVNHIKQITTAKVVIPINHMRPEVEIGERVIKGQVIAMGDEYVHASISGVVTDITIHPFPHPSHLPTQCIIIEHKGIESAEVLTYETYTNYSEIPREKLIEHLHTSGIVGLGGAGFSTSSKLERFIQYAPHTPEATLLINATECEPVAKADYALTLAYTEEIITGALILGYIANIDNIIIAVEDADLELYAALTKATSSEYITITQVPTFYSSGAEKVLIKEVLDIDIATGEYAVEKGVLSYNIATIKSVYDYIIKGVPLMERVVTITGEHEHPHNIMVPIGTPIRSLITDVKPKGYIRTNGIMMGIDVHDSKAPILKTTNVVIHSSEPLKSEVSECIKCSECVPVCPEKLLPQQLYFFIKGDNIPKAQSYRLDSCILCRCCDEVCPSNIPLSEYFRFGKAKTKEQQRERHLAEQSKQRFEFRQYRLERNKQEREEMMARKREAAKAKLAKMQQERDE